MTYTNQNFCQSTKINRKKNLSWYEEEGRRRIEEEEGKQKKKKENRRWRRRKTKEEKKNYLDEVDCLGEENPTVNVQQQQTGN